MPSSITTFLGRQWFLIGLVVVMLLGCLATEPLRWMSESPFASAIRSGIVAIVIFLTTLPVEAAVIKKTMRRPTAPLLATLINFGVLPLIAWALSVFLTGELKLGFLVTAATPCTVASAAVWTRRAGGNDVVAIMVTIITNVSCFVVTAVWLGLMTEQTLATDQFSPIKMIQKLALVVLLPIFLAQIARQFRSVEAFTKENKKRLSMTAQAGLLLIVLFGAVKCGLKLREVDLLDPTLIWQLGTMIMLCAILHTFCLWLGQFAGKRIGLERPDWIAVGFAGSQKTLAVGLEVALMVGGGLIILPMVAYHFLQLFIDTLVANRLGG